MGTDVSVSLFDMSGRVAGTTSAVSGGAAVFTDVPSGVYLVQVSTALERHTMKVTVAGGAP